MSHLSGSTPVFPGTPAKGQIFFPGALHQQFWAFLANFRPKSAQNGILANFGGRGGVFQLRSPYSVVLATVQEGGDPTCLTGGSDPSLIFTHFPGAEFCVFETFFFTCWKANLFRPP